MKSENEQLINVHSFLTSACTMVKPWKHTAW